MIGRRGPNIVAVHSPISGREKGIKCCCCMCCTCFNWNFLKTPHGILKIAEAILKLINANISAPMEYRGLTSPHFSLNNHRMFLDELNETKWKPISTIRVKLLAFYRLCCQSLAVNYGLGYAGIIGKSYHSFLTTTCWGLMTTLMLLFCYVFSEKSIGLIRQSLFETTFNALACFSYLSSCSYLGFAVNTFLYPLYIMTPFFQVYPAMTAAYILGLVVGCIHGYDAYKSYKYFKGYR